MTYLFIYKKPDGSEINLIHHVNSADEAERLARKTTYSDSTGRWKLKEVWSSFGGYKGVK